MSRKADFAGLIFMVAIFLMGTVALAGQVDGIGKNPGNGGGQGQGGGERHEKKRIVHGKVKDKRAVDLLMDDSDGDVEVEMGADNVYKVKGRFKIDKNKPSEVATLDFIDRHRNAFGLQNPKAELKQKGQKFEYGAQFQQMLNGVPVWQKGIGGSLNKDKEIREISLHIIPTPDIDTNPHITAEDAIAKAKADLNRMAGGEADFHYSSPAKAELYIYENRLVYEVYIPAWSPLGDWYYYIDANNGDIVDRTNDTIGMYKYQDKDLIYLTYPFPNVNSNLDNSFVFTVTTSLRLDNFEKNAIVAFNDHTSEFLFALYSKLKFYNANQTSLQNPINMINDDLTSGVNILNLKRQGRENSRPLTIIDN